MAVAVAVVRRLGGMAVAAVRRVVRRALLPVQLFVDRLLGKPEDLADTLVEELGVTDEGRIKFNFQVYARTAAAVIVVRDLARDADISL